MDTIYQWGRLYIIAVLISGSRSRAACNPCCRIARGKARGNGLISAILAMTATWTWPEIDWADYESNVTVRVP